MMQDRFPFPLPTGWFQVAWSNEVNIGDVLPLKYFNTDLVLFRDSKGTAHVLDAFCPHLGAHLGHGGKMNGDSVVCPFHAWEFDGSGTCSHIPYAKKIPKKSTLKTWDVLERNGQIMVWHDIEGKPPHWEIPVVEEFGHEKWTQCKQMTWEVNSCNQEMAENQVDAAHFCYLHGTVGLPKTTTTILNDHHLHTVSTTRMTTPGGEVDGQIEVNAHGFGFTTTRFHGIVETLLISSATPINENRCKLWFSFTLKQFGGAEITKGIGRAFVKEISRQLEQDIPIWENKAYLPRPLLCDGDGPIGKFRVWAKKFYPSTEENETPA